MNTLRQLQHFATKHFKWIAVAIVIGLVILAIVIVATSLPPQRFTILTGREDGAYYQAALRYQEIAAERGYQIDIRPTSGSVETLELLQRGEAGIGFVQGGIATDADPTVLSTMASLFYEPLWGFYNPDSFTEPLTDATQLIGKNVAIGEQGSGTNQLVRDMLAAHRVDEAQITILEISSAEATAGLRDGSIDAGFFVSAPTATGIQQLLRESNLRLMNFDRAAAYSAQFPYLTSVILPQGAIDLPDNIPDEDKQLVTTAANLIVRNDFHPDLLRLMTIAVVEVHEAGGLFESRFEFPNFDHADLPIGREERAYLDRIRSGESTLDNYLPFWAAALIDRYLLFVLPIAILLVPIISRSPVLITLYNRRKVTRWYGIVRSIDQRVQHMDLDEVDRALADLDEIEAQLQEKVTVGEGFMSLYYDLRGHIDLVQERLRRRREKLLAEASPLPAGEG
jgi:TRAP transporter TAXI family solute receptor